MKISYFWPALGWAFFILVICNASLGEAGSSPMFFAGFDKLTHTGLFFVLTTLVCYGIQKSAGKLNFLNGFLVACGGFIFGGIIEVLQIYVFTWRDGEWADLFCDMLGTAMALFSLYIAQWGLKK